MPSSARHRTAGLVGVLAAVAITAALTFALHARVALSKPPQARGPLPVEATIYQVQDAYTRPGNYLGTVMASRKSTLGFETGGTLAQAPPREGTPVEAGAVIARLDPASLNARKAAAQADLAQARSELKLAQLKAKRQSDLQATGAVSREAWDESRLRAEALQARVEAAQAQLHSLEVDLEKSVLRAPYAGVIADRYVYDGAVVNPGTPVVKLVETGAQEVHVGIPAARAAALTPGDHYQLRLRGGVQSGQLLALRPDINPVTRATTAIFALPAALDALDGEPAVLEIDTKVNATGGWLPLGALLEGYRGTWTVLALEPEGEFLRTRREIVEVLDIQGDRVYVRGSIADGTRVVASGLHRVSPGALVRIAGG